MDFVCQKRLNLRGKYKAPSQTHDVTKNVDTFKTYASLQRCDRCRYYYYFPVLREDTTCLPAIDKEYVNILEDVSCSLGFLCLFGI